MTAPSVQRQQPERRWSPLEIAVATVAFGLAAIALASRAPRPPSTLGLLASVAFFALVVGVYLGLGIEGVRRSFESALARTAPVARLAIGPALLFAATVGYAWVSGLPVALRVTAYALYLLVPPLFLALPAEGRHGGRRIPIRELLVVLALWLPIEFRLLPPLPLPSPNGYDVRKLLGLVEAMYLFLGARPLARVGYTYRLSGRDAATAVAAFLGYALVALPIGFATAFIGWDPDVTAASALGAPLIIYLVVAVPEEFLFRGLLQNVLTPWLGARAGLAVAAVVFGLAHLPDARYVLLAAIAGVAYGWVYQRTGKITASAITHALVNGAWGAFLGG